MEDRKPKKVVESSNRNRSTGTDWNSIWKLNSLPKIKAFLWKACHNVVPTCEALSKRHHSRSAACQRCGHCEESLEHALFFCPSSVVLWRASEFNYSPSPIGFKAFADWSNDISKWSKNEPNGPNMDLIAWTIWGLWKQRNKMIFEKETVNPVQEWLIIKSQYEEFVTATDKGTSPRVRSVNTATSGWEPPQGQFIKVNCDASFNSTNGKTGIAAVARNRYGMVIGGSNELTKAPSAFVAECLALRLGCQLADQHGWTNVEFESDCKSAIDMINGKTTKRWDALTVILDICLLKTKHAGHRYNYVSRKKINWPIGFQRKQHLAIAQEIGFM